MSKLAGTVINNLELKDLSLDQAEAFLKHVNENRAIYSDFIPFVSKTHSLTDMLEVISRALKRQQEGLSEFYTLWDGERMAGYYLIREIEREARWAEIGYMLGSEWQHRGITKKVCTLLINELFNDYDMQKIVICCIDSNLGSIGVAKSLGFQLEGNLRNHFVVNEKLCSMLSFGLLKKEWE